MRFKLVALIVAGAVLVGCETPSDGSASTSGEGSASTASGSTGGLVTSTPSGVESSVQEEFIRIGDRVRFAFDRYDLTRMARETLENQSSWLKRYPRVRVTIAGHADERGTREYNLALGERRANSVKNYLVALGIDPNRVRTISFGKERPVDPRSREDAWAKNRRGVTELDSTTISQIN